MPIIADPEDGSLLSMLIDGYRGYLHMPDDEPACALLGVVAADRMKFGGRRPWLFINGPPGSGKTELLKSIRMLPRVHVVDEISLPGLLSGSGKRDRAADASGGVLRKIGDRGILLNLDFTSVLSQDERGIGPVLGALRRVYDGEWSRDVGSDGGISLMWEGDVTFLAGVTQEIDRKYTIIAKMGDRWCQVRMKQTNGYRENQSVAENLTRLEPKVLDHYNLINEVMEVVEGACAKVDKDAERRINSMAAVTARSRSLVQRDSSRDGGGALVDIPQAEAPTRVMSTLLQMYYGLRELEASKAKALRVCRRVAMDSIPLVRRLLLERLVQATRPVSVGGRGQWLVTVSQLRSAEYGAHTIGELGAKELQTALGELSEGTIRRALQDMKTHGVLEEGFGEDGRDGEVKVVGQRGFRPSDWVVGELRTGGWL